MNERSAFSRIFRGRFHFGRQMESGVFGMSKEINNTIFVYSGTGHPEYLPSVFSLEFERSHLESNEGERKTETEREPRSKARICSAIYHGLLFPIVGESRRIVDAREKGQGESLKPCPIEFA